MTKRKIFTAPHPGKVLLQDFLSPRNLNQSGTARLLHVSQATIFLLTHGKTSITPAMAYRLGRLFGTGGHYWLFLQNNYDLGQIEKKFGKKINRQINPIP
jgi:addiction module HigA family antidote